jgi:hypothetical protein
VQNDQKLLIFYIKHTCREIAKFLLVTIVAKYHRQLDAARLIPVHLPCVSIWDYGHTQKHMLNLALELLYGITFQCQLLFRMEQIAPAAYPQPEEFELVFPCLLGASEKLLTVGAVAW